MYIIHNKSNIYIIICAERKCTVLINNGDANNRITIRIDVIGAYNKHIMLVVRTDYVYPKCQATDFLTCLPSALDRNRIVKYCKLTRTQPLTIVNAYVAY